MKNFICCLLVCFIFYTGYMVVCNACDVPTSATANLETVTTTTTQALTVTTKYCETVIGSVTRKGAAAGLVQNRNQRILRRIIANSKNPDVVAQLTELNKTATVLNERSWLSYMEAGALVQLASVQALSVKDSTDDMACVVRANCIRNYCQAVVLLKKAEVFIAEWEKVNKEMLDIINVMADTNCDDRET